MTAKADILSTQKQIKVNFTVVDLKFGVGGATATAENDHQQVLYYELEHIAQDIKVLRVTVCSQLCWQNISGTTEPKRAIIH